MCMRESARRSLLTVSRKANEECAPGCRRMMVGDGTCDPSCALAPSCAHDEGDCLKLPHLPRLCGPRCPPALHGDGVCDKGCNTTQCALDFGDCVDGSMPRIDRRLSTLDDRDDR